MKKLFLLLLSLFFISVVYADIDTLEGTATADTDTYEGSTTVDTIEGQTIATAAAGGTFSEDTFSDEASNVDLTAHTGETGATWTTVSGTNSARVSTTGVCYVTTSPAINYSSGVPDDADYTVEADVTRTTTATIAAGVIGRCSTSAATFYHASYDGPNGYWELQKYVAGTPTTLDTYTQALTQDQAYKVTLDMSGTTIKLLVDDVERISETDSSITATGRAGLMFYNANTSVVLDNFEAID